MFPVVFKIAGFPHIVRIILFKALKVDEMRGVKKGGNKGEDIVSKCA